MNSKIKYTLFIVLILLTSCNEKKEEEIEHVLIFSPNFSSVNNPFFRDSILIRHFDKDSILIKNYYKGNYYENIYFSNNGDFYEKRYVSNLPEQIFEIDTILSFTTKDTSLIYKSRRDNFIVTLIDLSLFNSRYEIQRVDNNYKTTKQSLLDTTYKEIFFYDKDYHIYKFINTWKGNICVYVEKK